MINGQFFDSIGIREKGELSNSFAWSGKTPLRIKINAFAPQTYEGVAEFTLGNAFEDPSFQREVLSFDLLRHLGVSAPRTGWAAVYLDGRYLGLYVVVEPIEKPFLLHHFGEDGGALYEGNGFCFEPGDLKHNKVVAKNKEAKKGWGNLQSLIRLLQQGSNRDLADSLGMWVNVQELVSCLAVDMFLANADGMAWGQCHNYYLYQTADGQLHWIPWDYNQSFGYGQDSAVWRMPNVFNVGNPLIAAICRLPQYREMYRDACDEIADYLGNRDFKQMSRRHMRLIRPYVRTDTVSFFGLEGLRGSLRRPMHGGMGLEIPGIWPFVADQIRSWHAYRPSFRIE
jgi:spore coat protein CotH